jgi:hypothetical protein
MYRTPLILLLFTTKNTNWHEIATEGRIVEAIVEMAA